MKEFFYITALMLLCQTVNAQSGEHNIQQDVADAWQYLHGPYKPYNPSKAFELYLNAANSGNAKAMNAVGMMFGKGLGVQENDKIAFAWFKKAADNGYARGWYNLGIMYKFGNGCTLDYSKAYVCFHKASLLQEPVGWYAQGYMLYKGLGCQQDYKQALTYFIKGAQAGKAACMYFLGLCFRNGYGITANADSAKFWLSKSDVLGYQFATDELTAKEPESFDAAVTFEKEIKVASANTLPAGRALNKYAKIEQSMPAAVIEGNYKGYLIKYDYSGQHIVHTSTLNLALTYSNGSLRGQWTEDDSMSMQLNASFTPKALVFKNMQYQRTDHYHPVNGLLWNFDKASLKLMKSGDSVFLTGNLQMFSPQSKEPEKPLFVALVRTANSNVTDTSSINFVNDDGELLKVKNDLQAYPNPFNSILTIDFELKETGVVYTQLLTVDGKTVYSNAPAQLSAGNYTIPIQPNVPPGTYIVRLYCGKQAKSTIVIKQ